MKEIIDNISKRVNIRDYYLKETMMEFLLKTRQITMVTINTKTPDQMEEQVDKKYIESTTKEKIIKEQKSLMTETGVDKKSEIRQQSC